MSNNESSLSRAYLEMIAHGVAYSLEKERGYKESSYFFGFDSFRRLVRENGMFLSPRKDGGVLALPAMFSKQGPKNSVTEGLLIIGTRDGTVPQSYGDMVRMPEMYWLDEAGLWQVTSSAQYPDDLALLPGVIQGQQTIVRSDLHADLEIAGRISKIFGAEVIDRARWGGFTYQM